MENTSSKFVDPFLECTKLSFHDRGMIDSDNEGITLRKDNFDKQETPRSDASCSDISAITPISEITGDNAVDNNPKHHERSSAALVCP